MYSYICIIISVISCITEVMQNENHQERDPDLVNRYVAKIKNKQRLKFKALKLKSQHAAGVFPYNLCIAFLFVLCILFIQSHHVSQKSCRMKTMTTLINKI